jgi:hypothetical protein
MRRRHLLGLMGTGAAGLAVVATRAEASARDQIQSHDSRHAAMLKVSNPVGAARKAAATWSA